MVSNRLIALALVAALVQALTLSFRLAAAAGDAQKKDGAAPPLSGGETPQQFALYCKAEEEPAWSPYDQAATQLAAPAASLLDEF